MITLGQKNWSGLLLSKKVKGMKFTVQGEGLIFNNMEERKDGYPCVHI